MSQYREEHIEDTYAIPDVRERLILCGIAEIEERGVRDFSLRRVAAASGVSCAAPYKHFKDKEDMLRAILGYIDEKWTLFERHIVRAFETDDARLLIELSLANIRFWMGNPHFRAVCLAMGGGSKQGAGIGRAAENTLLRLCEGDAPEARARRMYTVRALVLGAVAMLEDGTLENTSDTYEMIRRSLAEAIGKTQ